MPAMVDDVMHVMAPVEVTDEDCGPVSWWCVEEVVKPLMVSSSGVAVNRDNGAECEHIVVAQWRMCWSLV